MNTFLRIAKGLLLCLVAIIAFIGNAVFGIANLLFWLIGWILANGLAFVIFAGPLGPTILNGGLLFLWLWRRSNARQERRSVRRADLPRTSEAK